MRELSAGGPRVGSGRVSLAGPQTGSRLAEEEDRGEDLLRRDAAKRLLLSAAREYGHIVLQHKPPSLLRAGHLAKDPSLLKSPKQLGGGHP